MGMARKQYNFMWNHYVARRLGVQGQPPPVMRFGKTLSNGGAETYYGPIGQRSIVMSNRLRKYLKNPAMRNFGQVAAAHEMRHAYQPDDLWQAAASYANLPHNQRPIEIDANQFARGVMRRVRKDAHRHKLIQLRKQRTRR